MGMVRTIQCDICEQTESEKEYGAGWPGWAIINGIAAVTPIKGESLTEENMRFILCPEHCGVVTNFLTDLQNDYIIDEET